MKTQQRKTIVEDISIRGIGVFCGEIINVKLSPANCGEGIRIIRTDIPNDNIFPVNRFAEFETNHLNTTISNGINSVKLIEHLISAIWCFKITDINIYIDHDEIPMLDGSAKDWIKLLGSTNIKTFDEVIACKYIKNEMEVKTEDKYIIAKPCDHLKITYTIDFPERTIGKNTFIFDELLNSYGKELMLARTFCTEAQVENHKKIKKAFSTNDIVIYNDNGFRVTGNQLRYSNEATRHKVLDLIGDLTSTGDFICGEFTCYKSGHAMNREIIKLIYQD